MTIPEDADMKHIRGDTGLKSRENNLAHWQLGAVAILTIVVSWIGLRAVG